MTDVRAASMATPTAITTTAMTTTSNAPELRPGVETVERVLLGAISSR